ncbi:DUF2197 domain-containing protein [Peribacillus frigoritolerans]|uniref:DUF2197 domain-containing protein n=1 Tax=Peribacillus frigoritolerans TaxID=450367 RepID=UPI003DA71225
MCHIGVITIIYYEVLCYSCKKIFRVYEGSLKYKQFKERKSRTFCCDDCGHKIRIEAIKNFFR